MFGLPGFHIFRFPCCTADFARFGPPGPPRLNLGYNLPSIGGFLTPWAPSWANWQCLGCLASTFSGFRVARRILPVLGPPGSTLVTITQVFVLLSPPELHSELTGIVWVAWLPHF